MSTTVIPQGRLTEAQKARLTEIIAAAQIPKEGEGSSFRMDLRFYVYGGTNQQTHLHAYRRDGTEIGHGVQLKGADSFVEFQRVLWQGLHERAKAELD